MGTIRHLKSTSDRVGPLGTGKLEGSDFAERADGCYLYAIRPIRPALVGDMLRFRQADLNGDLLGDHRKPMCRPSMGRFARTGSSAKQ